MEIHRILSELSSFDKLVIVYNGRVPTVITLIVHIIIDKI